MKSIALPVPGSYPAGSDGLSRKPRAPQRVGLPLLTLVAAALLPPPTAGAAHLMHLPDLCPFRVMTGLPCPGCGMTRALVCIAHGHFADSFGFHPLGGAVFAALVVFATIRLFRLRWTPTPRVVNAACCMTIALLLGFWAARLLHYLPYPP